MLTIFSTCKPFRGHFAIIQRNAITSWTLLRPRPEIILFGDEEGVAEICAELGLRHVPEIARNEFGTPLLNDLFEKAQQLASYDVLCYVNADIIFLDGFVKAIQFAYQIPKEKRFLMVGARLNMPINFTINFSSDWQTQLLQLTKVAATRDTAEAIDYFIFRRGMFQNIPPFALGRFAWDNWIIYYARSVNAMVIDCQEVVLAVHQTHDHRYHGEGSACKEAERNRQLLKQVIGKEYLWVFGLYDCTHVLTRDGIIPAWRVRGIVKWFRWEINRIALFNPTIGKPLYWCKAFLRSLKKVLHTSL
jgi:hypothetical protein